MRLRTLGASLIVASIVLPVAAQAGMGNRDIVPKYHAEPCQGDACRADDTRSGLPCQGLICSFSSAKAMQPPMTAAQAADAQRAAAAAESVKPIDAAPAAGLAKTTKKKQAKAKTKVLAKTDPAEK